ncbi:hypothetical protein [Dyadobacter alkalitolerans]|uniref:hypothetical protein n=1 Tax=Dyadobacter alkalitolerans TaxID=492736 RepID=UPI0004118F15|nr:hypothetical protein [Dyadobacter alkalitolerans]
MDRKHFIKTFATMAGGLTLVNCSNDLITEMVEETDLLEDISIEDAKLWFENDYLPQLRQSQRTSGDRIHKRKAAWDRAQKPQNKKKKEYVWVPIDYEDEARPGIVVYDEETLFKKELSKYYLQPVIEGLIVIKVGKKNLAFLAQIAYDMQEVAANNFVIDKSKFTGTLLKVDWDDNLINGVTYEKGIPMKGFADVNEKSSNERTQTCYYFLQGTMNTWYVNSYDELVIVVHNVWSGWCDGSGSATGNGGFGGFGGGSTGGGGSGGDYPGSGSYYDPYVHSDAGNIQYPPPLPQIYNFNVSNAIAAPGNDRLVMNNNLKETMFAINTVASIQGITWEKASALIKSIGGNINNYTPTIVIAGKTFNVISFSLGGVGLLTSIPSAYITLTDGQMNWADARAAVSVVATTASIFASGWVAVSLGTISLGIMIYEESL